MFDLLLEKEPSEENIPEEEPEEAEPEEEEEQGPDEETLFLNNEIMSCFAIFDKKQTGTFEIKYLEKALRALGIFLTDFEVSDLKESLNQNGFVSFENFYTYAFEKLSALDAYEALKIAFENFDPDKDNVLPNDRFRRWMTTLGDPLTEKEIKELTKMGDPSGKGSISYTDLALILIRR